MVLMFEKKEKQDLGWQISKPNQKKIGSLVPAFIWIRQKTKNQAIMVSCKEASVVIAVFIKNKDSCITKYVIRPKRRIYRWWWSQGNRGGRAGKGRKEMVLNQRA